MRPAVRHLRCQGGLGVGPLVAARALVAPIPDIAEAIVRKDERFLRRLPGIGPQKCRNIVVQLEGKVAKYALLPREDASPLPPREEAHEVRVLVRHVLVRQMGLRPGEADQAIRDALARRPGIDTPEALSEELLPRPPGDAVTPWPPGWHGSSRGLSPNALERVAARRVDSSRRRGQTPSPVSHPAATCSVAGGAPGGRSSNPPGAPPARRLRSAATFGSPSPKGLGRAAAGDRPVSA